MLLFRVSVNFPSLSALTVPSFSPSRYTVMKSKAWPLTLPVRTLPEALKSVASTLVPFIFL